MDTVSVVTKAEFHTFTVPSGVRPAHGDVDAEDLPLLDLDSVAISVIDALAARWLDNLYANIKQSSPFKLSRP